MNRKRSFLILLILGILLTPNVAQAHVLLRDNTSQSGAILHVQPDDDPIAGKRSTLFFDIQNDNVALSSYSFSLQVADDSGSDDTVPIEIEDGTVSAVYAFPSQGLYEIVLTGTPTISTERPLQFSYAQRVSRGLAEGMSPTQDHVWAEIGMVVGLCVFVMLVIIGYNNRKDIARYSKF